MASIDMINDYYETYKNLSLKDYEILKAKKWIASIDKSILNLRKLEKEREEWIKKLKELEEK